MISFLTSSLDSNKFTWEGKAQLQKAKEKRNPNFVKLQNFYVWYYINDFDEIGYYYYWYRNSDKIVTIVLQLYYCAAMF